ncbi:hypothetical protein AB4495_21240 [Vibrio splendidus]
MIELLKFLVFLLALFPLFFSIKKIFTGRINTAIVIFPVFFLFYIVHLFLDVVLGKPIYISKFYSLEVAVSDTSTILIYLSYLILITLLFCRLQRRPSFEVNRILNFNSIPNRVKRMLLALAFVLTFTFILSPNPADYVVYGKIRDVVNNSEIASQFYGKVALISMVTGLLVLLLRVLDGSQCPTYKRLIYLSLIIISIYLNNKRLIMSFLPLYFFIEVFFSNNKRRASFGFVVSVFIFFIIYYLYSVNVKLINKGDDSELLYFYLRHELGRDDTLMFAINRTIIHGKDIMEYPGQSFVATLLNYFPREFYENKPYPYGQYFSNALLKDNVGPGLFGWTVTTSILDEFVSNFKIFGLPLSLLFVYFSCSIIDSVKSTHFRIFLMFIFMLLFIVHTSLYAMLIYIALYFSLKSLIIPFLKSAGATK